MYESFRFSSNHGEFDPTLCRLHASNLKGRKKISRMRVWQHKREMDSEVYTKACPRVLLGVETLK